MTFKDVDLLDIHVHDPFTAEPLYEWMREQEPLYWDAKNQLWAVSRYEDVLFVSKHTEIFCSRYGVVPGVSTDMWPDEAMINKDGEDHTCQRGLVSKGFTPRRVAGLEDSIRGIVDELFDRVTARGECDLVRDIARPLPMYVIGQMLGYPRARCDEVLDWTDVYVQGGNGSEITQEMMETFANFTMFHEQILAERKEKRGDDLISIWLDAEIDGKKLSDDKLMWEHNLLLVGGSETTRHSISLGTYELLRRPDELKYLREHPELIPNAAEEMIRYACPFTRMQRTLLQDHQLHGKTMKAGDKIVMMYPAANRDPRAFDRPQEFDIRRSFEKPALAFGFGKHYCLGASLARLEMKVFLQRLLARTPDMAIAPGAEPEPKPGAFLRGIAGLKVAFAPNG